MFEVLGTVFYTQKLSPTIPVVKEPGLVEVTMRNSDINKFSTKNVRNRLVGTCESSSPAHEGTVEEKISNHIKEHKKNIEDIKFTIVILITR